MKWNVKGEAGHPQREETRKKISETLKKHKKTKEHLLNIGKALKGREILPEWRKKMSIARLGKPAPWNSYPRSDETRMKLSMYRGELASNWKGGLSFQPYPAGWTKTYKKRIC